jgi:hypothetical protein
MRPKSEIIEKFEELYNRWHEVKDDPSKKEEAGKLF